MNVHKIAHSCNTMLSVGSVLKKFKACRTITVANYKVKLTKPSELGRISTKIFSFIKRFTLPSEPTRAASKEFKVKIFLWISNIWTLKYRLLTVMF